MRIEGSPQEDKVFSILSPSIIPVIVFLIILWTIIVIPFKIIGYGFMPPDDALRHSAKVVSGKDWSQILVLRDDIKMDSHPGWHAILGFVHKLTKWDTHSLVLFSVISLFILFFITPVILLRYPESWLMAIVMLVIASPGIFFRTVLGRPYIVTMSVLVAISILWPRLRARKVPYGLLATLIILITLSTWIHCSWYLYILPIIAFFLAREWRAGVLLSICAVAGILMGAVLTLHPFLFLKQTLLHIYLAFGNTDTEQVLVGEFRPFLGDFSMVVAVAALLGWRALRGASNRKIINDPVFIIGVLSFVFGFLSRRVWIDWGIPAIMIWAAQEFEGFIAEKMDIFSWRRVVITASLAGFLYLSMSSDAESRWSRYKHVDFLSSENPEQAPWLPEPGGIVYSDSMGTFYMTFFKNPHANWRYILGFEPGLMPPDDLKIYRDIQKNMRTYVYFDPWVKKMRPQDRLIINGGSENKPKIPQLEWYYAALGTWVGRLPRGPEKPPINK